MVYKWKEASRIKADAQEAAKVMYELANNNSLNAETLVEVSKPETAPLHKEFEWDDGKAAIEYRKHQARNIINALVILPEDNEPISKEPIRAFFNVEASQANYTPVIALVSRPETRELLLRNAIKEMVAFQSKYRALVELAEVMSAIEKTVNAKE